MYMFLDLLRKFIFGIVSLFYVTGVTWQHDSSVYCSFPFQHFITIINIIIVAVVIIIAIVITIKMMII